MTKYKVTLRDKNYFIFTEEEFEKLRPVLMDSRGMIDLLDTKHATSFRSSSVVAIKKLESKQLPSGQEHVWLCSLRAYVERIDRHLESGGSDEDEPIKNYEYVRNKRAVLHCLEKMEENDISGLTKAVEAARTVGIQYKAKPNVLDMI